MTAGELQFWRDVEERVLRHADDVRRDNPELARDLEYLAVRVSSTYRWLVPTIRRCPRRGS